MEVDPEYDQGHKYWMGEFKKGAPRDSILNYFKQTAAQQNVQNSQKQIDVSEVFDDTPNKRALFVLPRKAGDIFNATSLLPSFHKNYKKYDVYFCCDPKYYPILG